MSIRKVACRLGWAGAVAAGLSTVALADDGETRRSFAVTALRASATATSPAEPPIELTPSPGPSSGHEEPVASAVPGPATPPDKVAAPKPEPSWPRTLVEVRRSKEPQRVSAWSKADIEKARTVCNATLAGLDVVALPVEPFRDGDCGAPAAVQLVSMGRSPEVTFSPPPVVTCEMVAGLAAWLKEVQPAARKHLGSPLIRIEVMSSYSCRNAYGMIATRLSEHGRANAVDIGGFLTSAGYETAVLEHWGPTQRGFAKATVLASTPVAYPTATTQTAPATQPIRPAASVAGQPAQPAPAPMPAAQPVRPITTGTVVATAPTASPRPLVIAPSFVPSQFPSGLLSPPVAPTAAFAPPNRLGGPKEPGRGLVVDRDASSEAKSRFLKDVHDSACRIFGTVLGPEANRAHENHFHVDMADRRTGRFCE